MNVTYTKDDYVEQAYADALLCVASGEPREETFGMLLDSFAPWLDAPDVQDAMADAYRDARRQGVESGDIDASWHVY